LETAIESSENGQVLPLPLTNQERERFSQSAQIERTAQKIPK
jgi:hypothetical protein